MSFAKGLTRVINSTGMSFRDFANWVNIPDHTLREWASGRSEPKGLAELRKRKEEDGLTWSEVMADAVEMRSVRHLMNIRRLTGCTWEELLDEDI